VPNRLAAETSPYLLQHKDNPVDWYPWGEEAFARARSEDMPVFLSVGYSSCHWCHVMEHESFEDEGVAEALNAAFVSIKVDREERPDVDEAYMTAVQLSSGRGGWPMTVFLTPDKKPLFAGTYFPREDRGGQPGFLTICRQIAMLWKSQRAEIEENASQFALGLAETIGRKAPATFAKFNEEFIANGVRALAADFDEVNGGFGGAPKFPPHTAIDFLLRYSQRGRNDQGVPLPLREGLGEGPLREGLGEGLRKKALGMALFTLEKMALGGIHDHVGGGFHRYSTDAEWHLSHFEKMLYDNALMAENLATASRITREGPDDPFITGFNATCSWIGREMTAPENDFYSAIDADSEGEEGKFYVWTEKEVDHALGDRTGDFKEAFGVVGNGNFRDERSGRPTGANVLHARRNVHRRFNAELKKLFDLREMRVRPRLDDKVLVSWNGLAIAALPATLAEKAASAILRSESALGRLPHEVIRDRPRGSAFLDDYAAFALGLFARARVRREFEESKSDLPLPPPVTGYSSARWREQAERLTYEMVELFWDDEEGGFFSTSKEHEELFGRSKPVFDSPTPSGNALALRCLIEIGDYDRAWRLVNAFIGWMERAPTATEALYAAAMDLLDRTNTSNSSHPFHRSNLSHQIQVVATLRPREIRADAGGVGRGEIVIDIPEGVHINSHTPPAKWLVPTEIRFEPLEAEMTYPEAPDDVYRGEAAFPFTIRLPKGGGWVEEFEVRIRYQACTESECQLPEEATLIGTLLQDSS